LGVALAAALLLPWLAGQWVRTWLQPGLADDVDRTLMRVDFMVLGGILFGLSMFVAYACGCWIVAVMQGPARRGDAFPGAGDDARDPR
jgi:uncharacterized membrane protein YedE/YeeE